jgi:hypothetical protein
VTTRTLRVIVTVLLVASAALFAIGVAIERDSKHDESHASLAIQYVLVADEHAGESPAEGEPGHRETGSESGHSGESAAHRASEAGNERVFGIDIESPALVVVAVAVSLLLAAALWLTGGVLAPLALAGFALVAAIFDVREVFHQIDESRTNLIVIAAIVAALHAAVASGAAVLARRTARGGPASIAP